MTPIRLGGGAEFDLIRRFLDDAPIPRVSDEVIIGPGDDCVVLRAADLALSVDMSVEDVHFVRTWLEPEEIGFRATAAALSDLAAMAATPVGVLVALAVHPRDTALAARLMDGAKSAAADAGAALLGGDTTRSPGPMIIDVVVAGTAVRPATRRGARPGDDVWVTGELGAAAAAVQVWRNGAEPPPAARAAFARPRPRLDEARWLAERNIVRALIDLSDGLAGDADHLAAAGGVRIVLDAGRIPIHAAARGAADTAAAALQLGLGGGEDYELCFVAEPGRMQPLCDEFMSRFDLRVTCVGTVEAGSGVVLRREDGTIEAPGYAGYDHFAGTGM